MEVIPQLGGMVHRLSLPSSAGVRPVLASDRDEELTTSNLFRGRILFPFNDRIPDAAYCFQGKRYFLPVNSPEDGSAIHGLVYNRPFTVVRTMAADERCQVCLTITIMDDQYEGYPFNITLTVCYSLDETGANLHFTLKNPGRTPCPVSLGWHPYFTFGRGVDEACLHAGFGAYAEVDANLIPTQKMLPAAGTVYDFHTPKKIGEMELDMGFTAPLDGRIQFKDAAGTMTITQDTGFFPYTQCYIPNDRASIAVEPVTACTNAFNFPGLGLWVLAPNESRSGGVRISGL